MLLAKVGREVFGLGHVYYTIVFGANSSNVMSKLCLTFNVKKHANKPQNCVHRSCKKYITIRLIGFFRASILVYKTKESFIGIFLLEYFLLFFKIVD